MRDYVKDYLKGPARKKIKITVEVGSCPECPYNRRTNDMGAFFSYCTKAPGMPETDRYTQIPSWCPELGESNGCP